MHEFFIEAKPENTAVVLAFVSEWIGDCPAKVQRQIKIAVDEIFSNIARYAYQTDVGGAAVRVSVDDAVTIEFEDSGMAYDPFAAADPDTSLPVKERQIGGLGVFIVKNIMDFAEYRREGDKNILTIQKRLPKQQT